jgi:Family of unknown function (DUF6510)
MAANDTDFDPESLTLDANAVAGMLQAIFGSDMTAAMSECAHCGNQAMVGTMRAYMGPAVVLRCSICTQVVARIAALPDGSHRVEMRGAAYVRMRA